MSQADLIIVGAGTAGCLFAGTIARRTGRRVLLIEPPSTEAPAIDRVRPSRWLNLLGSSEDWNFSTQPSQSLANRSIPWPRGRGIGGSSRINAMIWFPPTRADRQMLIAASGQQWSEQDLNQALDQATAVVRPERPGWLSESSQRFMETAGDFPDANPMVYQRVQRGGRRLDFSAWLADVQILRGEIDRVLWNHQRATGVRVVVEGKPLEMLCSQGVVLCAGALATPTILMRSGVGYSDELSKHGIETRIDSPQVGKNLQDHLVMPVIFRTNARQPFLMNSSVRDLARWQTTGSGPVSSNIAECGGLFASKSGLDAIQLHVTPTHYLTFPEPHPEPMMTIAVNLTQPQSRGRLTLRSSSPSDPPQIKPGYLEIPEDSARLVEAIELARSIAQQPPLCNHLIEEVIPGAKRCDPRSLAKAVARYAQTLYHPVGTCALGQTAGSPVDADFSLRGCQRLWTVDASLFPRLTTGNPSASVMMLASLAADRIAHQLS